MPLSNILELRFHSFLRLPQKTKDHLIEIHERVLRLTKEACASTEFKQFYAIVLQQQQAAEEMEALMEEIEKFHNAFVKDQSTRTATMP